MLQSAGGRNVYMVEYGQRNEYDRHAAYSSATCVNGRSLTYYADKTKPGARPCVMLTAAIHGAEFEGVVSLLNLIHMVETGKDYQGNTYPPC